MPCVDATAGAGGEEGGSVMRAADGGGSISMAAVSPSSAIMSASAVEMSFSTFKWWDLNMKQAVNEEVSVHNKVTITFAVHKIMIVDFWVTVGGGDKSPHIV